MSEAHAPLDRDAERLLAATSLARLTASFAAAPCQCCLGHTPVPLEVERHHVYPEAVQRAVHGRVVDPQLVPLCRTAHRNLHLVLDALLAGTAPPRVNAYTRRWAEEGYRRILAGRPEGGDS